MTLFVIGLLIGLTVGGMVGALAMSLALIAKRADEQERQRLNDSRQMTVDECIEESQRGAEEKR